MIRVYTVKSLMIASILSGNMNAEISNEFSILDYASSNKDWKSNTTEDIDGNGLGTDGFIFFGDFDGEFEENTKFNETDIRLVSDGLVTASLPSYITAAKIGVDSIFIGQFEQYESIDNPLKSDGSDAIAGNLTIKNSKKGGEALTFTVKDLDKGNVLRVGILGAVINDNKAGARFDAPTICLSDGRDIQKVRGLPNLSAVDDEPSIGWVFFDINSDGDYSILVPVDPDGPDPDITGLGGVTFDTKNDVPLEMAEKTTPKPKGDEVPEMIPESIPEEVMKFTIKGKSTAELEQLYSGLKDDPASTNLVRIMFDIGETGITEADKEKLKNITSSTEPDSYFLLVGFSDKMGSIEDNDKLSSERVSAALEVFNANKKEFQIAESIYLGQTARFGEAAENRVVEVWKISQ